jgi:CRP-like cAMP-binding protein
MNAHKLKEKASDAFAKGKFARAAEAYAEVCLADPKDLQARLRMGDAWSKAGQKDKAIGAYQSAAEGFAKEGFLPRAIAASKLILELDPTHLGVQKMLADLYARKAVPTKSRGPVRPLGAPSAAAEVAVTPSVEVTNASASEPVTPGSAEIFTSAKAFVVPARTVDSVQFAPELITSSAVEAVPIRAVDSVRPSVEPVSPSPPGRAPAASGDRVTVSGETLTSLQAAPIAVEAVEACANSEGKADPVRAKEPEAPATRAFAAPPGLVKAHSVAAAKEVPSEVGQEVVFDLDGPSEAAPNPIEMAEQSGRFRVSKSGAYELDLDDAPLNLDAPPKEISYELQLDGDESLLQAVEAAAQAIGAKDEIIELIDIEEPAADSSALVALPKVPLFSDLPQDAFIALFEQCPLRRFQKGEEIIAQGSVGDSFFVICEGTASVLRTDSGSRRRLAQLAEGAFFGEMALLSEAPRTASVEAASDDTQLLEISAAVLRDLSREHPQVATALRKFCRQRLLSNVMAQSKFFSPFSSNERRQLVTLFKAREVRKGEVVIQQGQPSDGLYVVLSGEIEVRLKQTRVAKLKEGELFGEMSLLTKAPAAATCVAARRTSLLRLPKNDFDGLVMSHPQILMLVSELTDERNKQNSAISSAVVEADEGVELLV